MKYQELCNDFTLKETLKMYKKFEKKYPDFKKWLNTEIKPTFKLGDIITCKESNTAYFVIEIQKYKYILAYLSGDEWWSMDMNFVNQHTYLKLGKVDSKELFQKIKQGKLCLKD